MSDNSKVEHLGTAWACKACGHIMSSQSDTAPTGKCPQCKANPAHWMAAEVTNQPVDADVPSVADYRRDEVSGNDPAGLFATTPPGADSETDPELKVRY